MGDENYIEQESEVWNNAKGFSTYHVLFPLIECRKLTKVCLFGVEEIGQEGGLPLSIINQNKVNAMNRLHQELTQICDDVSFVMDLKTGSMIQKLQVRLQNIEKVIGAISRNTTDDRNGQTEIILNWNHFNNVFAELRSVLADIKKPLNMKNLIFPASDEIDMDKIKQEIIDGG